MRRGIWNGLFLISSFGLVFFFFLTLGQELFPEWRGIQAEYYRRLAEVTGDKSKAATPLAIRQIHLPQLKRVDRCTTCHVGVDNPKMAGQPQPFASHSDLGIPGFLQAHSFDEMGCTVCHHGQGSATTQKHAHGPVPHWERPLLRKDLIVGTCATCHQNSAKLPGAQRLAQAMALFQEMGCIGCHNLHGKGMLVGPELDETFAKSSDQFDFHYVYGEETVSNWVEDHFKDPQRTVPGYPALGIPESPMPNYELTEEEARMLTALVLSFHSETEQEESPIPARFKVPTGPKEPEPAYASAVERGKAVFNKLGCVGCHGPQGRGGVVNKNMDMGEEVPPLIYTASGYPKDELKEIIREGRTPARASKDQLPPPLWMPSWKEKLTEEELDALAEYLISLNSQVSQASS